MHVRPQPQVRPGAQVLDLGQQRRDVETLRAPVAHGVVDHDDGLREVRRAGRVADHSPDAHGVEGGREQVLLQRGELGHVLGTPAPARLGAAAQHAEAGARGVEQDAVERPGPPRAGGAVGRHDELVAGCAVEGARHETGPVRRAVGGEQRRPALVGDPGEQPGLAARAGRHVEPDPVRSVERRSREGEGDELAALVLDAGVAAANLGDGAGLTALDELHGVRRPAAALGARQLEQLLDGRAARTRDERHRGCLVVAREQVLGLGPRRPPVPARQRVVQRLDDPAWVGLHDRQVADGVVVRVRCDLGDPAVEIALPDPAQDGVDEAGPCFAADEPCELDGLGHGRVRRHAHE